MVRDPIAGPGLEDDLQPLDEAIAVFRNRNAEGPEVAGNRAPANTELDAAVEQEAGATPSFASKMEDISFID
jgi:hypothetical protein